MPLAASAQSMQPVSADLGPEHLDRLLVAGDRVIVVITTHDPLQPSPDCGQMSAPGVNKAGKKKPILTTTRKKIGRRSRWLMLTNNFEKN